MKQLFAIPIAAALAVSMSAQSPREHWVGTWATAPVGRASTPPPGAPASAPPGAAGRGPATPPLIPNNQTLREIVHTTVSGDALRVVFSNTFGTAPLSIGAASVALRERGSALVAGSSHAITFAGNTSTAVPPGAVLISDPVTIALAPFADVAVDVYLPDDMAKMPVTVHAAAFETNYVVPGNHVGERELTEASTTASWFYLARVEVHTSAPTTTIVTLGDSITDGTGSTVGANARWPDHLARRLAAMRGEGRTAVLNAGISGNRLLADGAGVNVLARLDRDVLAAAGVTHVVLLEGINDIGLARDNAAPSAADLIAAHRQVIERVHAKGLKIVGATLTPFEGAVYYTAAGESKRTAVNDWIRTGKAYDGVIDFDAAVRDPDNPKRFLPKYDRGDHLHPSDAGYEAMGKAIDLRLFDAPLMSQTSPVLKYPAAKKGVVVDDYHGKKIADPYRWMEDLDSADVKAWVDAENAITSTYIDSLGTRETFRQRIEALYKYPRVTVPFYEGRHWFYSRNTGLQKQSVVFTRESLAGQERVLIDPNEISPDGTTSLASYVPSPDGQHVAFGLAVGGSDLETFYIRDITTGRQLADEIKWMKFTAVQWTHDGKGFFYSRFPEPPPGKGLQVPDRDQKIFYHRLGTKQDADAMLYARPEEPTLFVDPQLDETGRYLFVITNKGTSEKNELFVKDLGDPLKPKIDAPVRPLYPGHTAAYEPLGVVNGQLFLRTDRGAPNSKIVVVAIDKSDAANWKTIVAETKDAIDSAHMIAGKIAINRMVDVTSEVSFYGLDGAPAGKIAPPGLGTIDGPHGRFDRPDILYQFTSPLSPTTVYRFDMATGKSTPFEAPKLTFDPSPFMTERVFFQSKDGTRVPMFVTHRKDLKKDGANPTMLYGYGGFDIATLPTFRPDVINWLEHGGVWATANMRGGSEYGEAWHHAGMFEKKQNVFDDFIAAAEYLVREKYASPRTLGIMGGSNGGLLVGAVMEQRPDLFAVALPAVGVMDMLRYDEFTAGVGWVTEYGSAKDSKAFDYLITYSPLHNIKPGTCYPATLATTADHDDRVVPSHTFKFMAALQAAQPCDKPVLIRVETLGSHGYRPVDKRIAELADEWAFAFANMKR